jgi:hypothetical protein
MKINLNNPTVLFGEEMKDTNLGKTLAHAMMQLPGTNLAFSTKLVDWANKLNYGETIDLTDESDKKIFMIMLDSQHLQILPFVRVQIASLVNGEVIQK